MREYGSFLWAERRFLAFGLLAVFLSGFGQTFFVALFGAEIRDTFDLSHGDFGLVYGLASVASAAVMVWAGRGVDRLDLRKFVALVVLCLAAGTVLIAWAEHLLVLLAGLFLVRVCGQGLMLHLALTSMSRYYRTHRGAAGGVAAIGLPLAEAVFPALAVFVAGATDWRVVWWGGALVLLVVALPALQWLLRGHGQRRRAYAAALAEEGPASGWARREVLRDPVFYGLLPAVVAAPCTVTVIFFHQAHIAEQNGWSLEWVATSLAAFAAAHVCGLLGAGPLVDRFAARSVLSMALLPLMGGLMVLVLGAGYWVAPVYLAFCGLAVGMTGTSANAVWAELYGTAHLGAIRAMAHACMVFSTALAPPLTGWLFDRGVTVEGVAAGAAMLVLVAAVLARGAIRAPRFRTA